jgi:hypothetical protein
MKGSAAHYIINPIKEIGFVFNIVLSTHFLTEPQKGGGQQPARAGCCFLQSPGNHGEELETDNPLLHVSMINSPVGFFFIE